jgi:D-arabinose 1-dehydrogenase-like Zn-dependent alcohol dehydrogenase
MSSNFWTAFVSFSSVGFTVDGLLAECMIFNEDALVRIPDYMSNVEAASLTCAAVTA